MAAVWGRIVVGFLVILGHLGAQSHAKSVAHVLCSDHPGEVCHDHAASESHLATHAALNGEIGHVATDDSGNGAPQDVPTDSDDSHDHCPILPIVVAHGAVCLDVPQFTVALLFVPAPEGYLAVGNLLAPPLALLAYAPKTSPPAAA